MALIGNVDEYAISINTNDGDYIPHFHIKDTNFNGNKFHTCIKIEKAEYFHHTGKENILNSKLRKELIKLLKSKTELGITHCEYLVATWNNNSNKKLPIEIPMPDYTAL
ncbi:MAG: hypothetical protein IKK05_04455 [Alistipes sp.]|nr:hypothetical protein [Alistipes sp.]